MPRSLGLTSLQLLAAARDGNTYGLDLVLRTGHPAGTVYPTLARLQANGLLRSSWEDQRLADRDGRPRRRYYRITAQGERALAEGLARVREMSALSLGTLVEGERGSR